MNTTKQTYINYLGQTQIAGLLKFLVVNNNGGMVISHTVKELALGHVQPLFTLSLGTIVALANHRVVGVMNDLTNRPPTHTGPDHPASKAASILSNSPFPLDSSKGYCSNSADVLHSQWCVYTCVDIRTRAYVYAYRQIRPPIPRPNLLPSHAPQIHLLPPSYFRSCRLDPEASNGTTKIYRKVPSRFRTGKGGQEAFDGLMGQLTYFGQTNSVPVLFPSGAQSVVEEVRSLHWNCM
jgi:hypothetical protein